MTKDDDENNDDDDDDDIPVHDSIHKLAYECDSLIHTAAGGAECRTFNLLHAASLC